MARRRVVNVLRHEWRIIFTSLNSAAIVLILPLVIIGQAFAYMYVATDLLGVDALLNILGRSLEKWVETFPELASLSVADQFEAFAFAQIPLYLLLVPCFVALAIATFSIVEEKQTRTLEPLLATPVRTWELLLGKSLAGAIPSLVMSWACAAFFILLTVFSGSLPAEQGLNARWLISLLLLAPLISVLSFMLGVVASSKASDAKSAQNMGVIVILPILALVGIQLFGLVILDATLMLVLSGFLALATLGLLRLAVRVFQRESIVSAWR
jgi:ABC-2 type transport system permease protein